jgi:hypothetical protein
MTDRPRTEYATVVCPDCGHRAREAMPVNACQFFYVCHGCGILLKPREGDCCVFCSYSDRLCPPRALALPCQERTLWEVTTERGLAELRLQCSPMVGWSIELFMDGRFIANHLCASKAEATAIARHLRRDWQAACDVHDHSPIDHVR